MGFLPFFPVERIRLIMKERTVLIKERVDQLYSFKSRAAPIRAQHVGFARWFYNQYKEPIPLIQ